MRLFWEEIKKIWRWPVVALILAANLLLFWMMFADQLDYSYNENGEQRVLADLLPLVGDTMEPEELPLAYEVLDRYYADLTAIMNSDPAYAEAAFTDARQLVRSGYASVYVTDGETEEEMKEARERLEAQFDSDISTGKYLEQSDYAYFKIQALSEFLREYEIFENKSGFEELFTVRFYNVPTEPFEKLADAEAHRNLFSGRSYHDTMAYILMCAMLSVVSIGILVLPYLTADNKNGMTQMQWSTKTGRRRTLKTQFAAVMLSAFALTLVQITVLLGLFLTCRQEYFSLMDLHIFGLMGLGSSRAILLNTTFGMFIVISLILYALLNFGATCVFFVLSQRNTNYVTELLYALPVAAVLAGAGIASFYEVFSAQNVLYRFVGVPGMEFVVIGIVFLIGIILCAVTLRGAQKRELLQ